MPTYEYECKSCKHTFDVFQAISDEPVKICPKCGKKVRRLINGGSGIIFKGHGFYVTDHTSSSNHGGGSHTHGSSRDSASHDSAHDSGGETSACPGCPAAESCPKAANS
ncbi:MAG: zinc ribbon domain-containing protein [Treponema sp.]|nr:zinc ribbon domain-containing protein [Treponema sp.]